uniref:RRM domain-containing protein n=1 Tax=Aquila chrysaetos chrysaetos TaxID=223781 RepID=A0A663FIQ6_AQUCH
GLRVPVPVGAACQLCPGPGPGPDPGGGGGSRHPPPPPRPTPLRRSRRSDPAGLRRAARPRPSSPPRLAAAGFTCPEGPASPLRPGSLTSGAPLTRDWPTGGRAVLRRVTSSGAGLGGSPRGGSANRVEPLGRSPPISGRGGRDSRGKGEPRGRSRGRCHFVAVTVPARGSAVPRLGEMVKLFIGNLPREATEQEIRSLFEQYGKVLECDIIKNYGFVHIEDKTAAEDAIRNLHHHKLHGVCINVEASKNKSKASTKLHVGNISPACTNLELRAKFEEYGPVIECDIVKDYAFVHMERAEDAVEAIRGLDNTEFQGPAASDGALAPPHRLRPPFLYGASPDPPPAPPWGLTAP